jgi:hypothetical protein
VLSCASHAAQVAAPEAADTHASAAADHTSSGTGAQWGRQPPQQPLQSHNRRTQGEARGSTAHSSPAPSGGGFSLWSLWVGSQHSSSSSSTSSSSGGGGVGTTAAHTNHQRAWGSRLERSAAAVTKQHAQRGLLQHHQASSSPHKPAATAPSTGVHVSSSSMEEEDAGSTATTSTNSSTLPVESLFLADLMPPAAAAALAAETPADSSSAGGQLALLLGDTYAHPGLLLPARSYRSSSSGGSAGTLSPLLPLPPAAPGASNGGDLPLSPSATSSLDGGDDWLAAVLSDPTDRLSANSNVVLTNSLRRIASLRNSGGPAGSSSAALPADAEGLLSSIRSRFGSFELVDFEEVALQLAKLGLEPDDAWLAAFDRCACCVLMRAAQRALLQAACCLVALHPSHAHHARTLLPQTQQVQPASHARRQPPPVVQAPAGARQAAWPRGQRVVRRVPGSHDRCSRQGERQQLGQRTARVRAAAPPAQQVGRLVDS